MRANRLWPSFLLERQHGSEVHIMQHQRDLLTCLFSLISGAALVACTVEAETGNKSADQGPGRDIPAGDGGQLGNVGGGTSTGADQGVDGVHAESGGSGGTSDTAGQSSAGGAGNADTGGSN